MVKLWCTIVGVAGRVFSVKVDEDDSVDELKQAIKKENETTSKGDADALVLFLAKKDGAWVTVNQVKKGVNDTTGLVPLRAAQSKIGDVGLSEGDVHHDLNKQEVAAGYGPVTVLVKLWTGIDITMDESSDNTVDIEELQHYQKQGQLIQLECKDYCAGILDKIESHYTSGVRPLPFICVEGSSGMGKSQLVFALGGGCRP